MFNMNEFKQKTKDWLKDNPDSSKKEFISFVPNTHFIYAKVIIVMGSSFITVSFI